MYSTDPELKKIQKVNLEMAQYFVDFCKSHDLLCYFCGGGAIGAIRHKGFIPWDDDADILMLRKDYRRFCEACKKELPEKYFLQDECSDEYYLWGYSKLRNMNTK